MKLGRMTTFTFKRSYAVWIFLWMFISKRNNYGNNTVYRNTVTCVSRVTSNRVEVHRKNVQPASCCSLTKKVCILKLCYFIFHFFYAPWGSNRRTAKPPEWKGKGLTTAHLLLNCNIGKILKQLIIERSWIDINGLFFRGNVFGPLQKNMVVDRKYRKALALPCLMSEPLPNAANSSDDSVENRDRCHADQSYLFRRLSSKKPRVYLPLICQLCPALNQIKI